MDSRNADSGHSALTVDLMGACAYGGCGSKAPLKQLEPLLLGLQTTFSSTHTVDTFGDAAISRIPGSDLLLATTVDFGTPVSRDPAEWGKVAAENALSDLWASGATPLTAVSVVGWPRKGELASGTWLESVLHGASRQAAAVGVQVVGGHTMSSEVPFFGLCVQGITTESGRLSNGFAKPRMNLVLTKPIGTGFAIAGKKARTLSEDLWKEALAWMLHSNGAAAQALLKTSSRCATDVSGFGLLGHSRLLAERSNVTVELTPAAVPIMECADVSLSQGIVSNAADQLMIDSESFSNISDIPVRDRLLMCDPQTSGGLLVGVYDDDLPDFLDANKNSVQVGRVRSRDTLSVRFVEG